MTSTGKIYRIICLPKPDIQYVGSTFDTLPSRWSSHKAQYTNWIKGKNAPCSIYRYFKTHGIENFKVILIKEYEVVDYKHLRVFEQLWMSKLKCVNEHTAMKIECLYQRNYYQIHKEKKIKYKSEYSKNNQDKIKASSALYREKNKEAIRLKKTAKVMCECGVFITSGYRTKHIKTAKHLNNMEGPH
jgi:hypothetical protein